MIRAQIDNSELDEHGRHDEDGADKERSIYVSNYGFDLNEVKREVESEKKDNNMSSGGLKNGFDSNHFFRTSISIDWDRRASITATKGL